MTFIVFAVFVALVAYVLFNPNSETSIDVVNGFLLIASNIATFFFTKHQVTKGD